MTEQWNDGIMNVNNYAQATQYAQNMIQNLVLQRFPKPNICNVRAENVGIDEIERRLYCAIWRLFIRHTYNVRDPRGRFETNTHDHQVRTLLDEVIQSKGIVTRQQYMLAKFLREYTLNSGTPFNKIANFVQKARGPMNKFYMNVGRRPPHITPFGYPIGNPAVYERRMRAGPPRTRYRPPRVFVSRRNQPNTAPRPRVLVVPRNPPRKVLVVPRQQKAPQSPHTPNINNGWEVPRSRHR